MLRKRHIVRFHIEQVYGEMTGFGKAHHECVLRPR
jgi:hypothetical protein